MSEDKLQNQINRGVKARIILEDPLLIEAFQILEDAYQKEWRNTSVSDGTKREWLWLATNVLGKIKDHLSSVMTDGRLAQKELDDLVEKQKRAKRAA